MLRQIIATASVAAVSITAIAVASSTPVQAQLAPAPQVTICPVKPGLTLNRIVNGSCHYVSAQPVNCPPRPGLVVVRAAPGSCQYALTQRVRWIPVEPLTPAVMSIGGGRR